MSNNNFKLGRTLPSETRKNRELELARLAARKRRKTRKAILSTLLILSTLALLAWVAYGIINMIRDSEKVQAEATNTEPTVQIIDENTGNHISSRVKDFVIKIEQDFHDLGMSVDRVILPFQKAREIDIFLSGRTEYYKMSLDRGTAVQSEDAERMTRHLDKNHLKPAYVDLRIEGKAYYK